MPKNTLYYGDNLDVLRRYVKDETIDLVYLDPPFNSNQDYNVLFGERNGGRAAAQIKAFEDTWTWDEEAARAYQETVEAEARPSEAMQAFRRLLGENDMLAYLSMMAPRLIELRRVLKSTGSLYLHCDPTASHYLKILMDSVFDPREFRNEVIWKRTSAHGNPHRWGPVHDLILFYSKGDAYRWNAITQSYDQSYLDAKYRHSDERGVYRLSDLTAAGIRHGHSGAPWRGYDPNSTGRHWAVPAEVLAQLAAPGDRRDMTTQDKLDLLEKNGFIYWTPRGRQGGAGFPQWKRHLGEGAFIQDVITDIPPINSQAKERLGYPTQKPQALLERIIKASSNQGDTVLDPFCGCGTAVAAAQALKRKWIGIDITHLAIGLIKKRLLDSYGDEISGTYTVIGEPVSVPDAERLAAEDPYQFQWWALGLVGARPTEQKKGADKGIDGRRFFHDDKSGETKQIIFSVKAGDLHATYVRDLRGVIEREKAVIGVMISFQEPTKAMRAEAASAGFYVSNWGEHPRIQLRTVAELLAGKGIDYPPTKADATFKKAPRVSYDEVANQELPLEMVAEPSKPPRRRKTPNR